MAEKRTLETPRLFLRGAVEEDAAGLHEAFTDPELMRYWSTPVHPNIERTQKWVSGMMNSGQNGITDFIICLKPTGDEFEQGIATPIGKIGIYSARPSNEIGFMLVRKHWRKGFAQEVLTAMLDYLFSLKNDGTMSKLDPDSKSGGSTTLSEAELQSEWLYPSISADTEPRNAASIGVLKKVGFVETAYVERNFEYGGEWVDTQYLKLERDQWLERTTR